MVVASMVMACSWVYETGGPAAAGETTGEIGSKRGLAAAAFGIRYQDRAHTPSPVLIDGRVRAFARNRRHCLDSVDQRLRSVAELRAGRDHFDQLPEIFKRRQFSERA